MENQLFSFYSNTSHHNKQFFILNSLYLLPFPSLSYHFISSSSGMIHIEYRYSMTSKAREGERWREMIWEKSPFEWLLIDSIIHQHSLIINSNPLFPGFHCGSRRRTRMQKFTVDVHMDLIGIKTISSSSEVISRPSLSYQISILNVLYHRPSMETLSNLPISIHHCIKSSQLG